MKQILQKITLAGAMLFAGSILIGLGAEAVPERDIIPSKTGEIQVIPIQHATLALCWSNHCILVDPVGSVDKFSAIPKPDLILITDIHPDHLDAKALSAVSRENSTIMAPRAVYERLPKDLQARTRALNNGETESCEGIKVEAFPMYNTTADRMQFHPMGRGNGYILQLGNKRVYISGDTEETIQMQQLKDIDVAFLCMNVPYTMDVAQAAHAVREFQPKIVYPYHYRGSDLNKFKELVGKDKKIEVRIRDWYATNK